MENDIITRQVEDEIILTTCHNYEAIEKLCNEVYVHNWHSACE